MTHFYLTLPSNSSSKYYPDNTLAHFTTRLQSSISLSSSWEVALTEIFFPRSWFTITKGGASFSVTCSDCPIVIPIFTETLALPTQFTVDMKVPAGYYDSIQDVINEMNHAVNRSLTTQVKAERVDPRYAHDSNMPKFRLHEYNNRVLITLQKNMSIEFSDSLSTILGIGKDQIPMINMEDVASTFRGSHVSDLEGGIHSLYVYCDILEHVPVGDTNAPLLRIVDTHGINGDMQYRSFEHPRYVPLQKKHFDSVEIDIRDSFGAPIPFESGQVIVTLHFRLAKNPYFL
jgi:hypothetical protein